MYQYKIEKNRIILYAIPAVITFIVLYLFRGLPYNLDDPYILYRYVDEEMKDRIFDHDLNHYDNFHPVFKSDNFAQDEVKEYQEKALVSYYFRINFIKKFIRNKFRK